MAKIDALLQMMVHRDVDRAVLASGKPYQIFKAGQRSEGSVTSSEEIRQLLEEIVPPSLALGLYQSNAFHFQYSTSVGTFDIGLTNDIGLLQVVITPAKAPPLTTVLSRPATDAPTPPTYTPPISAPPGDYPPAVQHAPACPSPSPYPYYPPPTGHPPYGPSMGHMSHRSKIAAGLLAIFLPGFGIHRFYLGYTTLGVLFLVLSFPLSFFTCGISYAIAAFWSFIEGIIILCDGMKDAEGRTLSS